MIAAASALVISFWKVAEVSRAVTVGAGFVWRSRAESS